MTINARRLISATLKPPRNLPSRSTPDNATNTHTGVLSASDFEYRQQIFQPELENNNPPNSENEHAGVTAIVESQTARSHDTTGSGTYFYDNIWDSPRQGINRQHLSTRPSTYYSGTTATSSTRYTVGETSQSQNYGNIPYKSGKRGATHYSGTSTGTGYIRHYGSSHGRGFYNEPSSQIGSSLPLTSDLYTQSLISTDPNCPTTESRVFINGMSCSTAVNTLGSFVCYNYERVSQECCQACLPLKQPYKTGCEYGDKSFQCRNIEPFDCYVDRNRNICCDRCQQFQRQNTDARPGCEYGDLTPRCQLIRQRPHLCYLGENQRLCCVTCPRLVDQSQPDCKWGNQNPDLCQPFDSNRKLRINCYQTVVREVCCATCKRLRKRITQNIPGCEYGDSPVQFSTGRGILDCGSYLRDYGTENCNNPDVATHCCYSCFNYKYGA
ncbi:hypothetical protein ACJMK2_020560 [Sinanodonta woodiana]